MRQDIKRERTNYTYDSIIGVVHLDWDQDEQLYLYMLMITIGIKVPLRPPSISSVNTQLT